jgi:tRNA (guanosine-2'-O-)-methyltransferase
MTPERKEKFKRVVRQRQRNLTVILENVHDPHNVGAVMRSCDSVGISEIFVLFTQPPRLTSTFGVGKRTSAGTHKWVDMHFYQDVEACFSHVRTRYEQVFATHLGESAVDLYDLDLTGSCALLFGNERDGISPETLAHADGNFIIPQFGMAGSLNISVACAISVYEAMRQRKAKGWYDGENPTYTDRQRRALYRTYLQRHEERWKPSKINLKKKA